MKKQDFLNAVEHEVKTLKKLATKKELKNLDFDTFNPRSPQRCIYGQMTGSCENDRAKKLMDKACIIVTKNKTVGAEDFCEKTYSEVKNLINGENTGQGWRDESERRNSIFYTSRNYSHLSALEAYICLKGAKVENIISFLRGESDKLVL